MSVSSQLELWVFIFIAASCMAVSFLYVFLWPLTRSYLPEVTRVGRWNLCRVDLEIWYTQFWSQRDMADSVPSLLWWESRTIKTWDTDIPHLTHTCMCTRNHTYAHTHAYAHNHILKHTHMHKHVYLHMLTYTITHIYPHTHAGMHTHNAHTERLVHTFTYACPRDHMNTHTHTYAHTDTFTCICMHTCAHFWHMNTFV